MKSHIGLDGLLSDLNSPRSKGSNDVQMSLNRFLFIKI